MGTNRRLLAAESFAIFSLTKARPTVATLRAWRIVTKLETSSPRGT